MKLIDLTPAELALILNDSQVRETTRLRLVDDHDKLARDSVVKISYGHHINNDFYMYVQSSRGHDYRIEEEELHLFEMVPDDTKLISTKRLVPKEKPAMIVQQLVDSTGQEINPGDYVIMSHWERLLHVKFVKQQSDKMFLFRYQKGATEFRRRLYECAGVVEVPESLKIWGGTLDHLMMRKLQGLG
jgi:hypothetical protein